MSVTNEKTRNPSYESEEFDWIQLRESYNHLYEKESMRAKFVRKFKENPIVPVGSMLTVAALAYGLYCFRMGYSRKSQMMMRARIAAQGITILGLVGSLFVTATKKP